ncbi:MAG: SDR family oxidoreductase [Bacteroidetes bacterium]|nr:SDR family oxidoreductase [Rhodothermia bacterium]MCS7154895.1 SDR family oxidoreductase [Bacteroidota bacterium]MCX7906946.1 SDR family oxidoreductase [Bacteroidota bacterium]MDW8137690.1 SDR family oxidoreductase [Bacteroidota bacterium]MDW8285356.1 SDR family oxidoreductase [Bacteroidota bacterium]
MAANAPTVYLTGASRGIGRAVALAFSETYPGARLALIARQAEALRQVAALAQERGAGPVYWHAGDVTKQADVDQWVQAARSRLGSADVLVLNAGWFAPGGIQETDPELFEAVLGVNLVAAFRVARAVVPDMLRRASGHVFTLCSVASIRGYPKGLAYCAAKHGLLGLTRALREELKAHGVRVTAVLPGATWTDSWAGTELPETRFMPPEDVARAIVAAYAMSARTVVEELLLRPQLGDV